jgi:peroxiredoxin
MKRTMPRWTLVAVLLATSLKQVVARFEAERQALAMMGGVQVPVFGRNVKQGRLTSEVNDETIVVRWFSSSTDVVHSGSARVMNIFWIVAHLSLWLVVLFLGFVLWGALRALDLLRWRLEEQKAITPKCSGRSGLRPGKEAPDFTLPVSSGGEVSLRHYGNRRLLLVFMQPGCGPCHHITPELNRLYYAGEIQVLVIHNADANVVQGWIKQYQPDCPVALQERFEVSRRYEVFATPFAFSPRDTLFPKRHLPWIGKPSSRHAADVVRRSNPVWRS